MEEPTREDFTSEAYRRLQPYSGMDLPQGTLDKAAGQLAQLLAGLASLRAAGLITQEPANIYRPGMEQGR